MSPGAFEKDVQAMYLALATRVTMPTAGASKRVTLRLPIQTAR